MSKRYSAYLPHLIYVSDIILLNIALLGVHLFLFDRGAISPLELNFILLANLSWAAASALSKSYKVYRPLKLQAAVSRSLSAMVYLLVFLFVLTHLFQLPNITNVEFGITYVTFFILLLVGRSILFIALDNLRKRGYNNRRLIVIGDKEISERLSRSLKTHPEYGYLIMNFIPDEKLKTFSPVELQQYILKYDPNEIFVCYKQLDNSFLNSLVDFADSNMIKVKVVSDLFLDNKYARLVNYDSFPAIMVTSQPQVDPQIIFIKRSFDILFSSVVMVIGAPVFGMIYLTTRATSKGTAFYKQERIGKKGKPFYIYKFRSMHLNSELAGPQLSSDNDPRITKWGRVMRRTRLDELPQFWNVLKGDMSVVGPRPERQHFIEKILERRPAYHKLMSIKPGITSMGQVGYGYAENIDQICDRVSHDLPYLQNMNINSDLNIILKTIRVMVQCKGK